MPTLEDWQCAAADQALLARADSIGQPTPADIVRLREDFAPGPLAAALELTAARRKASAKFPEALAATIIADRAGLEMATSLQVGAHKARRIGGAGFDEVHDWCSGIGADAIALGGAGLRVRAADADPVRAWMTTANSPCQAACADVTRLPRPHGAVHIDPARRSERGRSWRLADLSPGIDFIEALARDAPACAVKLGPGLPLDGPWPGELEFISEDGRLTNAVLWTGAFDSGVPRRATLLPSGATLAGRPGAPPLVPLGRWVHTIEPSVERADLLAELCAQVRAGMPHARCGLITADQPLDSPWLTPYEVIQSMPWGQRKVRAWLRENDGGLVTVKTRGRAVDPDPLQRELRGDGATPYTLFVLRVGQAIRALITRRPQPAR